MHGTDVQIRIRDGAMYVNDARVVRSDVLTRNAVVDNDCLP